MHISLPPSLLSFLTCFHVVAAITSYPNLFVDPNFFLNKALWPKNTQLAEDAIIQGAKDLAVQGPWAVTNKTILPPNNDTHTYYSWPPYAWPDCSKVGNKTVLTPEQIWVTCPYVTRDGEFNPDQHLVNNTGAFMALADTIFYNAVSWSITGSDSYSKQVITLFSTWFLNPNTYMKPNLNYAQTLRGPGVQIGQHTGVLDLKCMAKIASGVLMLKLGKNSDWTVEIDNGMKNWLREYIVWMTTNTLALQERASTNNHGTFYFNQLTALYLLANDWAGANATLQAYYSGIYQNQILASGEQPFEAERTHPYHYRAYNLAGMITMARLAGYIGWDTWSLPTKNNGTIQKATDYAMSFDPAASNESYALNEMFYVVGDVASKFGDPSGKYKAFLAV
ncbi:chondroitin AC/alginate lyase [Cantharellus anzutake]|uniref:chondroitin AC/alginate lyase n=1 Tax=Cantharellus anzutake TaxID=1750568 RepID=UPI0019047099|nr:chondroitin AC/alginate lyase [Cantharellus anzutake]KAF8322348.1 chondroitin AC/alginate lyase [Cantharellus anzutake]